MKALIFSMTCGEGHNMMARALCSEFEDLGVKTLIAQTHGYDKKREARENRTFLWACKHIPKAYDYFWNKLRKKNFFSDKLPGYVKNCPEHFKKTIQSFNPDIIICTHPYASSVISYLKKSGNLGKKIVTSTILPDFCVAPFIEHSSGVDFIFQPLENTTDDLLKKGFNKNQILTFGLPIRESFCGHSSLKKPKKFTVLNIGGGNGLGNTLKLLKSVLSKKMELQIVVINGKNRKNFQKIEKYILKNKIKNVTNLGFVSDIDLYMKAADVIITRCGSSCLSEAISIGKPMILREKMILNEKISKKFLIENGCALGMDKITDAGNKIELLKNNQELYNKILKSLQKFQRPHAGRRIVEFLIEKAKAKT